MNHVANQGIRMPLIILFLVACSTSCAFFYKYWATAKYPSGVEFTGVKKFKKSLPLYFSVRVAGSPIVNTCPLHFRLYGQDFRVADLTTASLTRLGLSVKPKTYKSGNVMGAFLGGADGQSRDYGMEFEFRSDKLVEFYARHSWDSNVPCPFELYTSGTQRVRFPVKETDLIKVFGVPQSVDVREDH